MRKILLFALPMAVVLSGCKKPVDIDPSGLSQGQREVENMIAGIGTIPTLPESNVSTVLDEEVGAEMTYEDPATGHEYKAIPVKTTKQYDITENPDEFVLINPWEGIWPGALIQGGTIKDGIPATVPISAAKRKPGTVRLTAVTGGDGLEYYKDTEMSASRVGQAMNDMISQHIDNAIDGIVTYDIATVQSNTELAYKLGLNVEFAKAKLETAFGSSYSKNKSYVAVKLKQTYFTIAVDNFEGVGGTFTEDVTAADLKNYTGDGNPLCYVASATYGRIFILLYESSDSQINLETTIRALFKGIEVPGDELIWSAILSNSKCKILQIGGDTEAGLEEATAISPGALTTFLRGGAKPSHENPGSPIFYKINYLVDNKPTRISNTLSYTVTEQQFVAAEPNTQIVFDFLSITAESFPTDGKYNTSYQSDVKLDNIFITQNEVNKEINSRFSVPKSSYRPSFGLRESVTIPLYYTRTFGPIRANMYVIIVVKGKIRHQAYRNGYPTVEYDAPLEIVEQFEFNTVNNTWDLVKKKDNYQEYAFKYAFQETEGGNMYSKIRLNYRFKSDGMIYPLNQ